MNLLTDSWIPVRRVDGTQDVIAPLDLLKDSEENPVQRIDSVRPDFDGALYQFLIGLYQVLLSPKDSEAWWDLFEAAPNPELLLERVELLAPAFELDSGEHRFMQDVSVRDTDKWEIGNLLIEINNMLFLKSGVVQYLCPACAAMALLTLQLNSPSGGRGHMTSLRGGGPLTTLLTLPEDEMTLWKTIVLNLLTDSEFRTFRIPPVCRSEIVRIFPWMDVLPGSKNGLVTTTEDMHPFHVYWNVPRRVFLDFTSVSSGTCDLCGCSSERLLMRYWSQAYGVQYGEDWRHPFTPYYASKDLYLPVRGKEGGVTYSNWLGLVMQAEGKNPATVITAGIRRVESESDVSQPLVRIFGYAMDNAKARFWQDGMLPTIRIASDSQVFQHHVSCLLDASEFFQFLLQVKVKEAYTRDATNLKGDLAAIRSLFWNRTEPAFYHALHSLADMTNESLAVQIKLNWLKEVQGIVSGLFEEVVLFSPSSGGDPGLVARAKLGLLGGMSRKSAKLCKCLDIPNEDKSKVKRK